jgi:hypothetical protein
MNAGRLHACELSDVHPTKACEIKLLISTVKVSLYSYELILFCTSGVNGGRNSYTDEGMTHMELLLVTCF